MRDIQRAMAERWARTPHRPRFAEVEAEALRRFPALTTIRSAVGATPLVPVPSRRGRGRVWLKVEAANATGTVKARTAYALLCGVLAERGPEDLRLVEYSGGSLGLALAEFCGKLGLGFHLVAPHGSPGWLAAAARAWGAEVSHGRPGTGFLGAMDEAVRVARERDAHLLLQHSAAIAAAMHEERTGQEIIGQLGKAGVQPNGFAAAVGSGGTVLGVGRALTSEWAGCRCVAVFPAEAPFGDERAPSGERRMNGTGGLGHGLRQPLLDAEGALVEFREVAYPAALEAMNHLKEHTRTAVCSSGAAAWLVASDLADNGEGSSDAVAVIAGRGTVDEWNHAGERELSGLPGEGH
jgi:cysteine synthase A